MDIIAATFNEHNRKKECRCPSCNITRMCEEMRITTERTNALVARYRGDFTNDRVSARV